MKSSQRELSSLKDQHDQVERRHRDEMMRMQDREMSPEKDEQTIRIQHAQLNELKHIVEKLKEEVRVMRQIKDDTVYALEQSEAKKEESCVQLRTRATIAEAERLAFEHRLQNAASEAERKDAALRAAKLETEQVTYQLHEVQKQFTDIESRLVGTSADYTSEMQSVKQHYEAELHELELQQTQVCAILY